MAREEELAEPGAFRVLDVLGESILLVRNREGQLRAFYNVCRHRGSRLCREPPARRQPPQCSAACLTGGRITCPYHPWTYDLDGRLIGAPHLTRRARLRQVALQPVPGGSRVLGRLRVRAPHARPGGAARRAAGRHPRARRALPAGELRIGHTIRYEVAANWKVIVRELQRVLPLRRRAPGAVRGGAGVPGARRRQPRLGRAAFRTAPAPTPSRAPARLAARLSRASTRTSRYATRASWSTRTCS